MTITLRNVLIVTLAVVLGSWAVYAMSQHVLGSQSVDKPTNLEHHYRDFAFFNATTTTATSTNDVAQDVNSRGMDIKGAKKITMYFTHGGTATTSTGGARFRVQVSPDRVNWYDFSRLLGTDVSKTATSTVTVQGATSTVAYAVDIEGWALEGLRCISNELNAPLGTDGEQSCSAWAEF